MTVAAIGLVASLLTIADAPFGKLEVTVPEFAARDFSIADFGAKPDGSKCTDAFAAAFAAAEAAGGGRVVVPKGSWLTGAVRFRNNCNLHLDEGATLEFTDDPADYPEVFTTWEGIECYNYSPLIYAIGVTNVAITGKGTIAPRMDFWRTWFARPPEHMKATEHLYYWCSTNAPLESRRLLALDRAHMRPHLIQFNRCGNVLLDGFKIRESPFWMIHLYHSENCVVRNLDTRAKGHNNDGIDIDMTKNVLVENCRFDQGDDGIVLKAGRNADAWRIGRCTENVVVRDCDLVNCHSLLGIGSELSGGVRNVWMTRCTVEDTYSMLRIKTGPRRGGFVENVFMDHCRGRRMARVFNIFTSYSAQWGRFPDFELRRTKIRNINISDCEAEQADVGVELLGDSLLPPSGIRVRNVKIERVVKAFTDVRDCLDIDFTGLTLGPGASLTEFGQDKDGALRAAHRRLRMVAGEKGYEVTELIVTGGCVRISYVLHPTAESFIRCQLALPLDRPWNGRFWGMGNGGGAGSVNVDLAFAAKGNAVAHTDMGTSRGVFGKREVVRDFGWRATHLMTVSGKDLTSAFFGRPPRHSYFSGGSTGGGQGFHEALRFPDDYDGILSYVPANTRLPLHVYFAWNMRLMKYPDGRDVFSKEELAAVEQAAIDWFADKDAPSARGKYLTDTGYSPVTEKAVLELAAKRVPSLCEGDKLNRLHRMFTGPVLGGRTVHAGVPFSASLRNAAGNQWMLRWYLGPDRDLESVTDEELVQWMKSWGPDCDACGDGYAKFAGRGGKMIVVGGLEDSVVPTPSMVEWYGRAARECGGVEHLLKSCRLFLLPGRAHGQGRGCGNVQNDIGILVDWVESGVAPEEVASPLRCGGVLTVKHFVPADICQK